jgi:hypothetical protein
LRELPYSLPWGSSVYAYVVAQNGYGVSSSSTVKNGAIILTNPDAPVTFVENLATKSATSIGVTWAEGASNGGTVIIDYRLSYDQGTGSGSFSVLIESLTSKSYVATGLTPGLTYTFKVQARNSFGFSTYSSSLATLCAFVPKKTVAPVSTISTNTVVLTWTAPYNNGSPITSYTIGIADSNGDYITSITGCDGTSSTVISSTSCIVDLDVLTATPFSLVLGDSITVTVMAHNLYGESLNSEAGGGADIVLVPDAPLNFVNVPSITLASRIGLSWTQGASSGGKSILDYRIHYDQSTDTWIELVEGVTTLTYTTGITLIQGRTYKFRI